MEVVARIELDALPTATGNTTHYQFAHVIDLQGLASLAKYPADAI